MTSQDTFEHLFREQLLDLIYAQWAKLGASFALRGAINEAEVIDPEALLWCSLEFLPTEPRLSEAVRAWIATNDVYLVRQRIYKLSTQDDPRTTMWEAIDHRTRASKSAPQLPSEPCNGLSSPEEVLEFVERIQKENSHIHTGRLGRIGSGPSTLLLRARDLLGHDIRHFLLVYLLANPHGARLRDVQAWSRHSYRSLAEAADRWESANVVTVNAGYCRLITPEPFRVLLQIESSPIVTINWLSVFEIGIRLLRDLAKARQRGLDDESTITRILQQEALNKLKSALPISNQPLESSVGVLLRGFEPVHV